jgi:prophage maintenance system killer protein
MRQGKNLPKNIQDIVIYHDAKGKVSLRADIIKETLWATQAQIAELFDIDRTVVTRHINNVFKDKEVDEKSNVQKMHIANSDKPISLYSLDIILSIGYRTNSKKAIAFRVWATNTLREYIVKGVVVNNDRIKKLADERLLDVSKKISFIQETIRKRELDQNEVDGLLSVINGYATSWALLQKYDEGGLVVPKGITKAKKKFEYDFVRNAINELAKKLISKGEASDLFGNERDGTFQGILRGVYQSFGGNEVYPSVEEKAAHLLYFIIKDHPFSDGNKRIGSFMFVLFLELNKVLYRKNGERKISDTTLVALALLIAESDPKEKDTMIALITNLLI